MVTVGNQGQDDRYIRLWRCNMSHPAVSRSCDCHVFGQAFLSVVDKTRQQRSQRTIGSIFVRRTIRQVKESIVFFIFSIIYRQTSILRCVIMVVVFSHQGGCCIFTRIHVPSHTTTRTLRMINHRNFPRNITTFLFAALELRNKKQWPRKPPVNFLKRAWF